MQEKIMPKLSNLRLISRKRIKVNRRKNYSLKFSKLLLFLIISAVFFISSIILMRYSYLIPSFETSSEVLNSPSVGYTTLSAIYTRLKKERIEFNKINQATQSSTLVLALQNGGYAYLNLEKEENEQVKILKEILNRLSIEGKINKVKYIDLRHEKAVIKFK